MNDNLKDNMNRIFQKIISMYSPTREEILNRPDTMPAFSHDFGNYVARFGLSNFQIQVIMKLDGRLDFNKLSQAARLCIEAEPILGCRFVEHEPPYWQRHEDIDNITFCSMEETDNTEEAIHRFLESHLDMDHDLMFKIKLIRSRRYDTLGIKLNHTCSDGTGTKDFIELLSHIYCCIDKENGVYIPKPSIRDKSDHEKIMNALGIKHPEFDNSLVEFPLTVWPFPWQSGGQDGRTSFVICKLPYGQLDVLSRYAKERGATINDLLITAYYRAMFKMTQIPYGIPMDLGVTVDLRRYLPEKKADSIRNLSGGIVIRIPRLMNEPFEKTLSRVVSVMDRKKSQNPAYQCATGAERMDRVNFHMFLALSKFLSKASEIASHNCYFCSPGLSNVGIISKSLIKFGEAAVTEAYFVPPALRAPGLLLVVSSYNGIMTLANGFFKGAVDRTYIEKLLDRIKNELIENCR